jgi:ribosome recycling factor
MPQSAVFDINELNRRMHGAVEALRHEFAGLRTGRASANMLDPIMVEAYGSVVPMNQVANVTVPESRLLSVQVWDRTVVSAVEKAIRNSNLGLNPQTEGQVIRLRIPELSQERRKELTKVAHQYAEKARVAARNVRRDGMEHLKRMEKEHIIGEDEHRKRHDEVQKLTDLTIKKIDAALQHKETEIMQV